MLGFRLLWLSVHLMLFVRCLKLRPGELGEGSCNSHHSCWSSGRVSVRVPRATVTAISGYEGHWELQSHRLNMCWEKSAVFSAALGGGFLCWDGRSI